jgi:hypothetical protein
MRESIGVFLGTNLPRRTETTAHYNGSSPARGVNSCSAREASFRGRFGGGSAQDRYDRAGRYVGQNRAGRMTLEGSGAGVWLHFVGQDIP